MNTPDEQSLLIAADTCDLPLKEPDDYYYEGTAIVFTASYHLRRGYCCGNGCRHCPYDHAAVKKQY